MAFEIVVLSFASACGVFLAIVFYELVRIATHKFLDWIERK